MDNLEVIKISETEIWVGKNKTYLLLPNLIFVEVEGEQSTELAIISKEICEELSKQITGKTNYLIDLNKSGKSTPQARTIWQEMSDLEKTNKVACYGMNPVSRVLASFVIGFSKTKNLQFFSTKDEAMNWLST